MQFPLILERPHGPIKRLYVLSNEHKFLQANFYTYVGNNPINYIDPNGLFFVLDDLVYATVGGALVGGIASGVTTYLTTGSAQATSQAVVTGAIGGAFAGLTAVTGGLTFASTAIGLGVDFLINVANAPGVLPDGSLKDFRNGLRSLVKSDKNACEIVGGN